jgi:hypothetical protein
METETQCLIEDGRWRCTIFVSPKVKAASINKQIPKAEVASSGGHGNERRWPTEAATK